METKKLLIRGGQVYDHDGNVHKPAVADILIESGNIIAVGQNITPDSSCDVIDARDRLVIPGFINAHYHSHDVLCRGLFEELPLEMWILYTWPISQNRSKEEVRARTLVGAIESLRCGITTVQDMLTLTPLNDEFTDVVIQAYRDAGIRVLLAPMVGDLPALAMVRHKDALPANVQAMMGGAVPPAKDQLDYLSHQFKRAPAGGTLHWALSPHSPQRSSPALLEGCAELSKKYDLPLYTHVYETRNQAMIARELFAQHGGSLIEYLASAGLLGPKLNIVHSVWITRREMERMADANAGIVLNHLSNMKLKSGVAPICDLRDAGVRLGLGCDNCSGSDVQSMFQAMKMFCLLSAVSEPEPGPGLAHEVLRHATLGNARTAGLEDCLGAIRPGFKADLVLIDLRDIAYLPYNSAARQLVYTESGRGVDTVIVDGKVVIKDRKVRTIDEDDLRREVADLMRSFSPDFDKLRESRKEALPYLLDAHRKVWQTDIGMNRFIPRTH
jgi:cytosine/adenosine deaminase-related metal-dependent hydrolase